MNFSRFPGYALCLGAALLGLTTACSSAPKAPEKKAQAVKAKPATPEDQAEFTNFAQWQEIADFIDRMSENHGFEKKELEALFRKTSYIETAIKLVKPAPPGKPKNWRAYRARFIDPVRINAGVAFWNTHADALARAEAEYGVPAEIIVGIIGVETVYGRNTGTFRVMDVLTTLGFDYPATHNRAARMKFFQGEVENTLLLAREAGIDPLSLRGSYAGAVGWPQFMPGSIRRYAVDFDGNGKVDLRESPVDAIGSVANFLVQHGWQRGEPTVFPATVSTEGSTGWEMFMNQGLKAKFTPEEMKVAGVATQAELPPDRLFGLIDLQNGGEPTEYWLGTDNFFAITQYNRSFFYAKSVIDLGQEVRAARGR